jgi:bifunctional non-homologous end joining protein LigD
MERRPEDLVFMAFDLLYLNGRDLRPLPLLERRQLPSGAAGRE